jgi:hypothetical protein
MSKKEKFKFCKAPFGSIYVRAPSKFKTETEIGFCCVQTDYYHMPKEESINDFWKSSYAQEFRKKFLNKEWPRQCGECQWRENNGLVSDIDSHIHIPIEQFEVEQGNEVSKPKYVDYRPDNLCNLMCTMCSPDSSSLIEEMWNKLPMSYKWMNSKSRSDGNVIIEKEDLVTKDLISKHTMQLKVLGGEPTINKKVHSVLQYAIDNDYAKDINLKITTNFTNVNKTYKLFDEFKTFKIQASIDATGPTYEYIRRPAKWLSIKEHLLEFADRYKDSRPKVSFSINLVWQLANCFTTKDWLPELLELYYKHPNLKRLIVPDTEICVINCSGAGTTLESVPDSMKHYIIDDLNDIRKDWTGSNYPNVRNNIDTLIKHTQRSIFKIEELENFKHRWKLMDEYKKTNMFELSPRFKELYEYECSTYSQFFVED